MSDAILSCAVKVGAGPGAITDTRGVMTGFADFSRRVQANMNSGQSPSQAVLNTPRMISGPVAAGGAKDGTRAAQVEKMIGCVGEQTGLDGGVTGELKGMYRDAVSAERFRQDPSLLNMFRRFLGQ